MHQWRTMAADVHELFHTRLRRHARCRWGLFWGRSRLNHIGRRGSRPACRHARDSSWRSGGTSSRRHSYNARRRRKMRCSRHAKQMRTACDSSRLLRVDRGRSNDSLPTHVGRSNGGGIRCRGRSWELTQLVRDLRPAQHVASPIPAVSPFPTSSPDTITARCSAAATHLYPQFSRRRLQEKGFPTASAVYSGNAGCPRIKAHKRSL